MSAPLLTLETATSLLTLANAHVWHVDHTTQQLLATPQTLALWLDALPGPDQLDTAALQSLTHPDDWAALAALWGPAGDHHGADCGVDAGGANSQGATVRLQNRHGAWRWLKLKSQVVVRTAQGLPLRSTGLVRDISTRMRYRIRQQLQQNFDAVMATSPDCAALAQAMLGAALAMPDLDGGGLYVRHADGSYTLAASAGPSAHACGAADPLSPLPCPEPLNIWEKTLVPSSPLARLADAGRMVCSFADGPLPDDPPFARASAGVGACEPILLERLRLQAPGLVSLVVVPLRAQGAVYACLCLTSIHARQLPHATVTLLHNLAAQFGLALEHLAAREEAVYQRENIEGFFQAMKDFVCVLDTQGRLQYISSSVREQLGYTDALLGQSVLALHPQRVHAQARQVVQAMLDGQCDSCLLPALAADGREVMVDTRIVHGHWNGQPALLAVSRDITELTSLQRKLELRAHYQQATLDNFPFLVWLKNPQGKYLAVNQPFARACGLPNAQSVVGLTDLDLWPAALARSCQANDQAVLASGRSHHAQEQVHSQGQHRWLETYRSPVYVDGQSMGTVGYSHDITARKHADAERTELLARLQSIAEQVPGVIYQHHLHADGSSHVPYASTALRSLFGIEPESVQHSSGPLFAAMHPEDQARVLQSLKASACSLAPWSQEYRVLPQARPGASCSQDVRWVQDRASPQRQPDGSTLWHGYAQDITQERHARERLRLAASVFAHSYDGIMVTDADNVIIEVNPAFSRITGYAADEVLGNTPAVLNSGRYGPDFYAAMWRSIREQGHWSGEIWNRRKSGEVYAEALSIAAMVDDTGQRTHCVAVFSDITRLKTHAAQLERIAHYDALTGLPNRRLLGERMQVALAHARRDQLPLAVCMLDVDGFKGVNDVHGHAAGDALLVEVARRLQECVREGDTVARLGGDEFVLLLSDLQHPRESHSVFERVLGAMSRPIVLGSAVVKVSASVGVTRYPDDHSDADTLLRHADQAMYAAKQAGKNRYHLFDPERDRLLQTHRDKLNRFEQALVTGELVLHYQPKVNLRTGAVIGMEALVRWQHPTEGLLRPGLFLPLIAGHALERRLGEWVIAQVLAQMAQWQAMGLHLVVSANISASHLLHSQFALHLAQALQACPEVPAQCLELEILETAALGDMEQASQVLHHCRALGVRFSLDDFGTGYSSLSHFRSLPVDMIKIDQSFVRDMLQDPNDLSMVDSVLRLAQAFSRPVIAEGVETLEHGSALLQLGCELAQGYGVARPMPSAQVPGWMLQWHEREVWKTLAVPCAGGDLVLSVARRSHQNWVASVLQWLDKIADPLQDLKEPPPITPCYLHRWLSGNGAATYSNSPHYQQVQQLHDQSHSLVDGLLHRADNRQPLEADTVRQALQSTSAKLLEHLEQL